MILFKCVDETSCGKRWTYLVDGRGCNGCGAPCEVVETSEVKGEPEVDGVGTSRDGQVESLTTRSSAETDDSVRRDEDGSGNEDGDADDNVDNSAGLADAYKEIEIADILSGWKFAPRPLSDPNPVTDSDSDSATSDNGDDESHAEVSDKIPLPCRKFFECGFEQDRSWAWNWPPGGEETEQAEIEEDLQMAREELWVKGIGEVVWVERYHSGGHKFKVIDEYGESKFGILCKSGSIIFGPIYVGDDDGKCDGQQYSENRGNSNRALINSDSESSRTRVSVLEGASAENNPPRCPSPNRALLSIDATFTPQNTTQPLAVAFSELSTKDENRQKAKDKKKVRKARKQAETQIIHNLLNKPVSATAKTKAKTKPKSKTTPKTIAVLEKPDPIIPATPSRDTGDQSWTSVTRRSRSTKETSGNGRKIVNASSYLSRCVSGDVEKDGGNKNENETEESQVLDLRFSVGGAKHDCRRVVPRGLLV